MQIFLRNQTAVKWPVQAVRNWIFDKMATIPSCYPSDCLSIDKTL